MVCRNCGANISNEDEFCSYCGTDTYTGTSANINRNCFTKIKYRDYKLNKNSYKIEHLKNIYKKELFSFNADFPAKGYVSSKENVSALLQDINNICLEMFKEDFIYYRIIAGTLAVSYLKTHELWVSNFDPSFPQFVGIIDNLPILFNKNIIRTDLYVVCDQDYNAIRIENLGF